ncbi:MAG: replicative helicase, partial [Deltaproteobacteria bacterium]|nr:replicative helicase [Deltaproteobacteria bacterium]
MDLLAQRLPPQNLEAETSVLGAVLLENEALNRLLEILREDDFYREAHRRIFSAILHLYEHSEPVDLITLSEVLKTRGELDSVGGVEYLNSLVNGVPTAANISYYAKIIKEKAILRKLINRATEIVSQSYSNSGD